MSEFAVGPGVLTKMNEEVDTPASHEVYIGAANMSLTVGVSGKLYLYTPTAGVVVYYPKDEADHR